MPRRWKLPIRLAVAAAVIPPHALAWADGDRADIGVRVSAMHVDHTSASDMLGAGLVWRHHLRDRWFAAFGLDVYRFDLLGPGASPGPDSAGRDERLALPVRTRVFSTALGRRWQSDRGLEWFWQAGLGIGIASVSGESGVRASGPVYDLQVETGAELHLSATVGAAWHFSEHWALTGSGRIDHQFVDLRITDRVSGVTVIEDSFTPVGVSLSLDYRF